MSRSETTNKIGQIRRQKVLDSYAREPNIRQALLDTMEFIPKDQKVCVFLSGGIDSHVILFAAMESGLDVSTTSFTLDTHDSTDFKIAKATSEEFKLDFNPVRLDSSEKHLKKWVRYATGTLGLDSKSSIECTWPLYVTILANKDKKHLMMGLGGDSYFLLAKGYSMHCRDMVAEVRNKAFRRSLIQNSVVKNLAFRNEQVVHLPFFELGRVYTELENTTDYSKLNTPQKSYYHSAFPELRKRCKIRAHQNFQLGDTCISKNFSDKLLNSDWNTRNSKAIIAIYNDVIANKV